LEATYNPELPEVEEGRPVVEEDSKDPKDIALRVVKADIEVAKTANDSEKDLRQEAYNLYRAMGDGKDDRPGRSRIKSSDVMDMIEWLMPALMKAFFGSRKCISVDPIGNEDITKAEKFQKLLNWQFVDKGNGFRTGHEWMKSSLVYGLSPVKVTWQDLYVRKGFAFPEVTEPQFEQLRGDGNVERIEVGSVDVKMDAPQIGQNPYMMMAGQNVTPMMIDPMMLEPYRVYRDVRGEKKIKIYSGPMVEVVPPEDFFCDPEARDIQEARFVIHRVKRTVSYLKKKEQEGIYSNIDDVIESGTVSKGKTDEDDDEAAMRATSSSRYSHYTSRNDVQKARRKIDVWEWWGLLDVDDSGIAEPYLVVVANNVIIRMERNPYAHGEAPFEVMRPILDIFTMKGISMVDLVGEYQKAKTALMRQTLDNISFQNNQMWEVDETAGVDIDSLINPRPGGVVITNRLGAIKQITPAPLEQYAYQTMEFIQGQLEQRTGITRYNQGLDANTLNKTASGIQSIMSASSQRIELIARVMAETGFRKLYKKMLMLNQQFIDQEIVIRVHGQPLEISPDDLAGNFDVSVDIGGATNKEQQEINQMMTVLNYSQILLQLGVMVPRNVYEIVKKIFETWGVADSEKYITDPQDTEQLRQIIQYIDQLGMMVQNGQPPSIEQLTSGIMAARQILMNVVGKDVSQEQPQPGVAPAGERESAGRSEGDGIAYSSGVIPGGPGGAK
jgi:hypothetical protein